MVVFIWKDKKHLIGGKRLMSIPSELVRILVFGLYRFKNKSQRSLLIDSDLENSLYSLQVNFSMSM